MSSETRDRIVAEALKLFAEKGFDGATTGDIARRASVAEGTIYRHFQDKKELFLACVAPAAEQALDRGITGAQSAPDLRAVIRAMMAARLKLMEENQAAFNILFTEAHHHPELLQMLFDRIFMTRAAQLAPVLQRLGEAGQLKRRPNFLILGVGLTTAIWGMITFREQSRALRDHFPLPFSEDDLLDELTDFVLYGIAGQQPGGER